MDEHQTRTNKISHEAARSVYIESASACDTKQQALQNIHSYYENQNKKNLQQHFS